MKKLWMLMCVMLVSLGAFGCGHTDEEMAAKQREVDKLQADLKAAKQVIADDQAKYTDTKNDLDRMKEKFGKELGDSKADAARLAQALSEYKQRADQLTAIEQRFIQLRSKLDKLTTMGVKVVSRNNRLVIQLPGDILFDTGREDLKQQGKDVLSQVAEVIRSDKDLSNRYFLVAGHTDNQKLTSGRYKDNWELSLARARQVLVYLIADAKTDPKTPKSSQGGGLNPQRWAAAGYGDTDPLPRSTMTNQTKEQQEKNRRVELVVQPDTDALLNLTSIANGK